MEKPKLKEASSFPRVTKVTDTMVGLSVLHCSVDKTTVTLERSQHVWADQHQSVVVHCGQRFIRTRPVAGLACNITWRVPKGGVQCPGSHTEFPRVGFSAQAPTHSRDLRPVIRAGAAPSSLYSQGYRKAG